MMSLTSFMLKRWARWSVLVAALLAVMVLTVGSQPPAAAESEANITWSDTFNSYAVTTPPTFPSPNWVQAGYDDPATGIYADPGFAGSWGPRGNVLRLIGIFSSNPNFVECGGGVAYRRIGGTAPMDITVYVANGNQSHAGCVTPNHNVYGAIELSTTPNWRDASGNHINHRGLIEFRGNGQVYGGTFEQDEGPGNFLGTFVADRWYKVRIVYTQPDANNVSLQFWIDDVDRGTYQYPAKSYEGALAYIGLWAAEGEAWFDDISVTAAEIVYDNFSYLPVIQR
jgi:hypothetical protein